MLWVEPGVRLSRELSPGLPAENLHLQAHTSAVEASASELCTGVLMVLCKELPFCAGFPKGVANHAPVMIGCVLVSDPPHRQPILAGSVSPPPSYRGSTDTQTRQPSTEMLIALEAPNQ